MRDSTRKRREFGDDPDGFVLETAHRLPVSSAVAVTPRIIPRIWTSRDSLRIVRNIASCIRPVKLFGVQDMAR